MYIQASQNERDLSINAIYNNETLYSSIRCIAEEILGRLMESNWLTDNDLDAVEINLENLFEEYFTSCSPEENAARLQFLINNTESVLSKIKDAKQSLYIVGHNTPNYELLIYTTEPNERFFLTAYSNLDDDMLWDEMIEWVDDLGYNDNL
jgi:hypothetical protein